MTNARIFFAGVGTAILLIGAGFGGGLMMAKTTMQSTRPSRTMAADRLPPVRVILPASAEAAPPSASAPAAEAVPAASAPDEQNKVRATDISARAEKDKDAERAEKKKSEAAEREHRKRVADRKAKREAARLAKQRQQQQNQQDRAPVMAFGDDEQPRMTGLFGN